MGRLAKWQGLCPRETPQKQAHNLANRGERPSSTSDVSVR
jgi:hypothetical protein